MTTANSVNIADVMIEGHLGPMNIAEHINIVDRLTIEGPITIPGAMMEGHWGP